MDPHRVEINLEGYVEGEFNLDSLRMGYRYSPWEERNGEFHQGILCNDRVVRAVLKRQKGKALALLGVEFRSLFRGDSPVEGEGDILAWPKG